MITYEDFLIQRRAGKLVAGIDNSVAMRLIHRLPGHHQAVLHAGSWVWMLSIPGAIAVAIWVKWWLGLLLLFFVTPMLSRSVKRTASRLVLAHATQDQEFFDSLVANDILIFKETGR